MPKSSPALKEIEDLLVDFHLADLDPKTSAARRGRIASKYRSIISKRRAHSRAMQALELPERKVVLGKAR
jgi:hypothetical protein